MIILDTNVLVWWTTAPERLSKKARRVIEGAVDKNEILVSSISVWEVYLLVKNNKLRFLVDVDVWLESLEKLPFIKFIPVNNIIASQSIKLPNLSSKDPADRIIIATALQYGATLITSDKKILNYSYAQSIW